MPKGSVKTLEEVCKALGGALISSESIPHQSIYSWADLKFFLFDHGVSNPEVFIMDLLDLSREGTFAFLVTLIYMVNHKDKREGTIADFLKAQKEIADNISEYEEILGDKFLTLLNESKGKQED